MARLARLVWIWLIIFALAAAAAWFADHPGTADFVWLGYRANTSVAVILLMFAFAAMILIWLDRLRSLTARQLYALYHYTDRLRARRAQDALVRGLVAAASGDAEGAKRHLGQAEKGRPDPRLLLLLRAQSARLSGDRLAAEDAFTAMLDSADTQGLGLAGLMAEARARGDDDRLRELTAQAHRVVLRARGLFEAAFEGEAVAGRWPQARRLIKGARRHGVVGRQAAARMRTVLLTAEARDLRARGEARKALVPLRRALALDPGFTPAAVLAADIEKARGRRRSAERIVELAWAKSPHPDLGRLYAELSREQDAHALLARARALAGLKPGHPESRLLVARYAAQASRIPVAEDALAPMLTPEPSARVCNLMAETARAARGRAAGQPVEAWLMRAARAPRDGFWRCKACGREAAAWGPLCSRCRTFDSMRWIAGVEAPSASETAEAEQSVADTAGPPAAPSSPQTPARPATAPGGEVPADGHAAEVAARTAARGRRMRGPVNPAIHVPTRPPDDPGPEGDDELVRWG